MPLTDAPRMIIADLTSQVSPLDAREQQDQADILRWVQSGAPLFRTVPPTTPPAASGGLLRFA